MSHDVHRKSVTCPGRPITFCAHSDAPILSYSFPFQKEDVFSRFQLFSNIFPFPIIFKHFPSSNFFQLFSNIFPLPIIFKHFPAFSYFNIFPFPIIFVICHFLTNHPKFLHFQSILLETFYNIFTFLIKFLLKFPHWKTLLSIYEVNHEPFLPP